MFFGDKTDVFGQEQPITVETIRIIDDGSNLQQQVEAITKFDEILTVDVRFMVTVSSESEYGSIIKDIIESSKGNTNQFHPYIYDTFKCFRHNKKHITVTIWQLVDKIKDKGLLSLIIPEYKKIEDKVYKSDISFWIDEDNKQNLINPDLFDLFLNLNTIYILSLIHI